MYDHKSMIEQVAQVHAIDQTSVWLDTVRLSTCNSCSLKSGCGQRLMNQATDCNRARIQLPIPQHLSLKIGDEVVLGVPQRAFIKASLMMFAMPLMVMLLAATVAQSLSVPEPVIAVTALLGLGLALGLLRVYSRSIVGSTNVQISNQWQTVILRQQRLDSVQELHFNE